MKAQVLSDLHIEFEDFDFEGNDSDVLILAGDIHVRDKGVLWALEHVRNKPVLYVLGNHEYYGKAYPKLIGELKDIVKGRNVQVLEKDTATINGVNFLGCTLWTDFELFGDPRLAGYECQQVMNDFKKIRMSAAYISRLESVIERYGPSYWVHGHLHNSSNYRLGHCTVVCNPRGYPGERNLEFNPQLTLEIENT